MGIPLTVPSPFDVIIDSQGYVFHDAVPDKAFFGNTSTFVPRSNTQGNYGDNQQDAWLSVQQTDWSLGEQQKYYRGNDEERARRFWRGRNVDVRKAGEISIRPAVTSFTPAAAILTATGRTASDLAYFATSTNLYTIDYAGTITDRGAHGLGASPYYLGSTIDDGGNVYLTTNAGGSVGVRRCSTGFAFTTYSATAATSLAWLNNTLYGYNAGTGQLIRYTPGAEPVVSTVIFTWQTGTGAGIAVDAKIKAFGGKLLIMRFYFGGSADLWLYDGTAPAKIAEFPANFAARDLCVSQGTVFISGIYQSHDVSTTVTDRAAVLFYKDGQQGELWRGETLYAGAGGSASYSTASPIAAFEDGVVFVDGGAFPGFSTHRLIYYNQTTGGISTVVDDVASMSFASLVAAGSFLMYSPSNTSTSNVFLWPSSTTYATDAVVDSSLIDFDSSLPKLIRGVRVEFEKTGTGTVDLAYRFDDVDGGAYTTLQTNAASGTEYTITAPSEGTTYRSISVRATLNRGATATSQVKLKRKAIRGMPVFPAYKKRTYDLYLGGVDGESPVVLRDGTPHSLDGKEMALNLQTAAGRTSPFTIKDHLDPSAGFIGRIDEGGLEMIEVRPQVWVARVRVREV